VAEFLEFENVSKSFGAIRAVKQVSLSIRRGEFFSLLGPSGCGKTTLLRILAGFEKPDTGRVILNGEDITALPPNRRKVNTIFQSYALFPHLNVRDNIAFGLRIAKRPRHEIDQEVDRMLKLIQMEDQAHKRPDQISGGQKQRIAVARALINKPEVGITFLYVTHDQNEAMSVSDRIAVMNSGIIEQVGIPAEIYEAPRSSFVAAFIGESNFFEGQVSEIVSNEYSRLSIDGFPNVLCFNDKQMRSSDLVYLSVRPEKIRISREKPESNNRHNVVPGHVEDVIYLGALTKYWVRVQEYRIAVFQQHSRFLLDEKPIQWHDDVWISWHADDGFMLERYSESDEKLMGTPPEKVGEQNGEANGTA